MPGQLSGPVEAVRMPGGAVKCSGTITAAMVTASAPMALAVMTEQGAQPPGGDRGHRGRPLGRPGRACQRPLSFADVEDQEWDARR